MKYAVRSQRGNPRGCDCDCDCEPSAMAALRWTRAAARILLAASVPKATRVTVGVVRPLRRTISVSSGGGDGGRRGWSWFSWKSFATVAAPIVGLGSLAFAIATRRGDQRKKHEASLEGVVERILQRLETNFAAHPNSLPVAGIDEKDWLPRPLHVKKMVHDILFKAPGRRAVVGPSGSGKASAVKMVARAENRNGVVFINLKECTTSGHIEALARRSARIRTTCERRAAGHTAFHAKTGALTIIMKTCNSRYA